jgi:Tol biopolymer transport system component
MSGTRLDPKVSDWIHDGPNQGPDHARRRALVALRQVDQRPRWMFLRAWPVVVEMNVQIQPLAGLALLFVLALLAAIALAAMLVGSPRPPSVLVPNADRLMAYQDGPAVVAERPDGSARRILSAGIPFARSPMFSPDGLQVAFLAPSSASSLSGRLMVVPVDGSSAPIDVSGGREVIAADVASISWDPHANRIAFAADDQGVSRIFVAAADGSGLAPITDLSADSDLPSWSPDGASIAYRVTRPDGIRRLLETVQPDGTNAQVVAQVIAPDGRLSRLSWSPMGDGQVAYWLNIGYGAKDVATIDLGFTHANQLWTDGLGGDPNAGMTWSPDGSWLAMLTATDGVLLAQDDKTTPYDGQIRHLGPVADCWVDWSPDGTALYGGSPGGCNSVVVIPLDDPAAAATLQMSGMTSWQPLARR